MYIWIPCSQIYTQRIYRENNNNVVFNKDNILGSMPWNPPIKYRGHWHGYTRTIKSNLKHNFDKVLCKFKHNILIQCLVKTRWFYNGRKTREQYSNNSIIRWQTLLDLGMRILHADQWATPEKDHKKVYHKEKLYK